MAEYDVAICGGRVVDGTGNPWVYADVGIKDGKVATIGKVDPKSAQRVINAKDLVVSPGFIDLHTHSEMPLLVDGNAQSKVRQGTTLDVVGEEPSVAPLQGTVLEEYRAEQKRRYGVDVDWTTFEGYAARVMRQGISMNVACSVSPQQVKRVVIGYETRPATEKELEAMKRLVATSMEEGAVGLCSAWHSGGPDFLEEEIALSRVAASYGGYYGTHMGSEGFQVLEELEKMGRLAEAARIPIHLFHLKIRGRKNWGKIDELIAVVEEARSRGFDVTANHYPYTAIHEPFRRLFPRWIQNPRPGEVIPRFKDRDFRDKVRADPEFSQYVHEHGDWEGIVASRFVTPSLKQYEGKSLAEIAKLRGQADPGETCFDLTYEEGSWPYAIHFAIAEDHVKALMQRPWVSVASDASAINDAEPGRPHPRNFGTNPRVLGKYVREEKVTTLENAIRKMSSLPAQILGVRDRGLLREGYWADVVVLDPDQVIDTATYERPKQYPKGIPYVLVNGVPVIDGGEHTGARPGKVVWGPAKASA